MKLNIQECLSRNIRNLRRHKNLSQASLAAAAGISAGFVASIEAEKKFPSAKNIENIAAALEVPVSRLFQNEQELFPDVPREKWCTLQGKMEEITVLTEEIHEMLEEFQTS